MISIEKIVVQKDLPNEHVPYLKSFRYVKSPYIGLGEAAPPFLYFDDLINKADVRSAYEEILLKIDVIKKNSKLLYVNGVVPTEINEGFKSVDSILLNYEKYLSAEHIDAVRKSKYLSEIKKIACEALNQKSNWDIFIHLREFTNFEKKGAPSSWQIFMRELPQLKHLVDSLPLKSIGYAVLFFSNPDTPIYTHRDVYPRNNRAHFININLDLEPRDFFIYDGHENKKIFRKSEAFSYMFNESDLHGAPAESRQRITLRVEGEFSDSIQNDLFRNKDVFNWDFPRSRDLILPNLEVVENTDI